MAMNVQQTATFSCDADGCDVTTQKTPIGWAQVRHPDFVSGALLCPKHVPTLKAGPLAERNAKAAADRDRMLKARIEAGKQAAAALDAAPAEAPAVVAP